MFRTTLRLFGLLFTAFAVGILSAGLLGQLFPGQQISYIGETLLSTDIFLLDLQTQIRLNLTNSPEEELIGRWSPDGTQLAYATDLIEGSGAELVIRDVLQGEMQSFAVDGLLWTADWSPNGRELAINVDDEIRILNLQTGEERMLTSGYSPVWSPDGQQIVFYQFASVSPQADILIINADGSDRRRLMQSHLNETFPTWSPNGDRIAFTRWSDTNGGDIFSIATQCLTDDSNCEETLEQLTDDGNLKTSLSWSRDGQSLIYFTEFASGTGNIHREIFQLFLSDGHLTPLTDTDSDEYSPTWWPFHAQTLPAANLEG